MKEKRKGHTTSLNKDTNSTIKGKDSKVDALKRMGRVDDSNVQLFKTPDISLLNAMPRSVGNNSKLSTSAIHMTNSMNNTQLGNSLKIPRSGFGKTSSNSIIESIIPLDTKDAERSDSMAHTTSLPLSHFLELDGMLDDTEMDGNDSSLDCLDDIDILCGLDSFEPRTGTKHVAPDARATGFGKATRRRSLEKSGRLRARQCKIGNWASAESGRKEKYFSLPRTQGPNGVKLQIENHAGSKTSRFLVEDVKIADKNDEDKNVTFTKGGFIESLD
ncbi:hypothetical protein SARC_04038 [Sphaeroforma arctica JP610]|uniref:Uncharacterized protein n=1 Tax=Sphaeroforma arctica JP610 TaxID=667725 RepID=A0A0L0G697_9EUKA|nr:hypothetical protein SARC_04038 [Sphaeroforma arctica JP610]KNC83733.1 hypothetical protein SARC_04038 [Sphaeroforma arctica JP610]|eukprot:XP_014157635.1 hypothetical protein SARC_04038 [Sphaeroforma arctica JP610]